MKKTLISWVAYLNDFEKGSPTVKADGPNASMHTHYWKYDSHLLLCAEAPGDEDTRFETLLNHLRHTYPSHQVDARYMGVGGHDLINLQLIQSRINALLLEHREQEIDLLVSSGTPAMHTAWHFAHVHLGLKTRLLQLRPKAFSPGRKKPELLHIDVELSQLASSSVIMQDLQGRREKPEALLSPSLIPLYSLAEKVAATDAVTALLLGESGTGKELLARHIHRSSPRRNRPFVAVNCAAMHDTLLESRLFGYTKGAFTGADQDRPGLFEAAKGGSLFLDEIGDISPYMQQALLRALQEKEITPVGSHKSRPTDLRIIAATNKDLRKDCQAEKFRWDLYYRLAVAELRLPSLLERGAKEVQALIRHFLKLKQKELKKPYPLQISSEAMDILLAYPWPGNVRELENMMERLYVYHEGPIVPKNLPPELREIPESHSLRWEDIEKQHIRRVLRLMEGNKKRCQEVLGYGSVNTLVSKMRKYGLD